MLAGFLGMLLRFATHLNFARFRLMIVMQGNLGDIAVLPR